MVSRGENRPSLGVGGTSTNCMPGRLELNGWWSGLLVIVSSLGERIASSSEYVCSTLTCLFESLGLLKFGIDGAVKPSGTSPNPPIAPLNL